MVGQEPDSRIVQDTGRTLKSARYPLSIKYQVVHGHQGGIQGKDFHNPALERRARDGGMVCLEYHRKCMLEAWLWTSRLLKIREKVCVYILRTQLDSP